MDLMLSTLAIAPAPAAILQDVAPSSVPLLQAEGYSRAVHSQVPLRVCTAVHQRLHGQAQGRGAHHSRVHGRRQHDLQVRV